MTRESLPLALDKGSARRDYNLASYQSKMPSSSGDTGHVQTIQYLKRNPKFNREEFWEYWQTIHGPKLVPLAEKYGVKRYQQVRHLPAKKTQSQIVKAHLFIASLKELLVQVRTFGRAVPNSFEDSAASTSQYEATEPVEFDGIAMFLVPSLDVFKQMVQDPYYVNIVEPDEHNFIDKEGPGGGLVAIFQGVLSSVIQDGKDDTHEAMEQEVKKAREWWMEEEVKAKKAAR